MTEHDRGNVIAVFGDACPVCAHSLIANHSHGSCLICDRDCSNRNWPPESVQRFRDWERLNPNPTTDPEPPILCWLAYYTDWSGMVVFDNELDALRHAVEKSMQVMPLKSGEHIR